MPIERPLSTYPPTFPQFYTVCSLHMTESFGIRYDDRREWEIAQWFHGRFISLQFNTAWLSAVRSLYAMHALSSCALCSFDHSALSVDRGENSHDCDHEKFMKYLFA